MQRDSGTCEYYTASSTRDALVGRLAPMVGADVAAGVAAGLEPLFADDFGQVAEHSLIVKSRRWVIRDDDINVLTTIADGVKAAASGGVLGLLGSVHDLGSLTSDSRRAVVGAAVSTFVAVLVLARRIARKGAVLTPDQLRVLCVLKSSNGLSREELVRCLGGGTAAHDTKG